MAAVAKVDSYPDLIFGRSHKASFDRLRSLALPASQRFLILTGSASSIPKGFRKLRAGETINRGDRFFDFDKWITTSYRPGTPITRQIIRANGDYIRRKPNAKAETRGHEP
jgi:hypothetical protein